MFFCGHLNKVPVLLKQSWNDIAKAKGQWILFDQIHLNERGAEIVFKLAKKFISES